jgi:tripartite-type tricarboxylate transporter receptor subunit TctC
MESGVKGFEDVAGHMTFVPAGTPAAIIARLHKEMVRSLNTPEVSARLANEGAEIIGNTPEQAQAIVNKDIELWADVIRQAKIPLQ